MLLPEKTDETGGFYRTMKKRILSFMLTLVMVIGLLPVGTMTVRAAVNISTFAQLQTYLNNTETAMATITSDITYWHSQNGEGDYALKSSKTINLNGHTVNLGYCCIQQNAPDRTITIHDTIGTGKWLSTNNPFAMGGALSTFYMTGGTISNRYGIFTYGGTTAKIMLYGGRLLTGGNSNVTVYGGSLYVDGAYSNVKDSSGAALNPFQIKLNNAGGLMRNVLMPLSAKVTLNNGTTYSIEHTSSGDDGTFYIWLPQTSYTSASVIYDGQSYTGTFSGNTAVLSNLYTATVNANKNSNAWTDITGDEVVLSTSSMDATAGKKTAAPLGGVFTFSGIDPATTMYVWAKNNAGVYEKTGAVSISNATATVNYYDVNLTKGTGINNLTGAGTYLRGETAKISAELLPGYTWSKWSDDNITQTNRSITVDKKYDLTAGALAIPATAPTVSTTGAALTYGYPSGSISVTATPQAEHTITGYKWYTCNSGGGSKVNVSGATSDTCTIPAGKAVGTYYYVCDVTTQRTDNGQTKTVTTSPAIPVTVSKRSITVTMKNKNRDYGTANPALDFAITSGSLVNSDPDTVLAVTGATTATSTSDVGDYDITGTSASANYEVTINKGTLTINKKASQTTDFTYDLTAKTYNGNAQGITVAPKSDTASIAVKYDGAEAAPTEPGTYAVTIDVSNATNYENATNLGLGNYTINKAETASFTLTSSKTPSTYEDEVAFTATVVKTGNGAIPTGNITFTSGGTTVLTTVALTDGAATFKKSDLPVPGNVIMAEYNGDSRYNAKTSNVIPQVITQKPIRFTIENTGCFYESGVARTIKIADTDSLLTESDFTVSYYRVDENDGVLASTTSVKNAVTAGKYLYVIDFKNAPPNYEITRKFSVSSTDLPNIASYDNAGYMDIKAAQSGQQKPISFAEGSIGVYVTDGTCKNTLTNENASSITYRSSNDAIAAVSADGTVTIKKAGTVTITATSTMANTTPVYASYVLTVSKKPVTVTAQNDTCEFGSAWDKSTDAVYSDSLTAADFTGSIDFDTKYTQGSRVGEYTITPTGLTSDQYDITFVPATLTVTPKTLAASNFAVSAADKTYDGTTKANVMASIVSGIYSGNSVKAEVEGNFTSANAADGVNVTYTITGLTGRDADNYALDKPDLSGTTAAKISPATVSVICASNTTRTFDGKAQSVDVSAMANGAVFDSSDYSVKYNGADSVKDVGVYDITIVLNSSNYVIKPFNATLTINEAPQEVFAIENVPDRVYYGDSFKVSAQDASGTVTYEVNAGAPASIDSNGNFVATGVGSVKITATSTKEGYTTKTATKTFTVYPRVVTPTTTAAGRVYNAQKNVDITVALENVMASDSITATATGIMANADAGTDKMVYVSGIVLDGVKKAFYTLGATTLQTTATIEKADISGFSISAQDKKYDGFTAANTVVTTISGVYADDLGQVGIAGSAVFDNETAGADKRVTYTAMDLTGAKASNYQFANEAAKTSIATADISLMNIGFVIGTATFQYDGGKKEVITSASDELGRVFTEYTVEYWKDGSILTTPPNEAGAYIVRLVLNDSVNYITSQTGIPMAIAQAEQEQIAIVGLPSTIEYSDEFTLEAIGGSGSGGVEWKSDNSYVTVDRNGTVKISGAVSEKVTITATKKDDINFTEKSAKVVFMPAAKTTGFTIDNVTQDYSGAGKEVTVIPDMNDATYEVTYNGNRVLPTDAGSYNVVVKANGNYKGTANTTLTIAKGKMNRLRVSQTGCIYGEPLADAVYDAAPYGVNVHIAYSTLDGKKPVKAGDYMVTATYSGSNYETFTASGSFKIEKRILTVKANNAERKYGEANPIFALGFDGFANGEDESVLLSEPVATTVATASSPVTDYAITVSGGKADNYSFYYDNSGSLKVIGAVGGNFYITGANNSVTVGDIFTLHAYYDNAKPAVSWQSSDETVAAVDGNGMVTVLKKGEATITAVVTDPNYQSGISTQFKLNASKKTIQLKPADLVKVYNAERQDIVLVSDDASFIPTLSGENKNIDIAYTLTTDSSVTEPKQAGVYTVTYMINHPSYTGGETVTMYINKATVTISTHALTKVYGEENPAYYITGLIGADESDADYIARITDLFEITSDADSSGAKTNASEYPITLAIKEGRTLNDDGNYNIVISGVKGKLTVTKAPLTVKVSDASREYGAENVNPAYEYVGFVVGETENDLIAKPVSSYDADVSRESNVGNYPDVITASSAQSNNYELSYSYTDGTGANLTINKRPVTVSAGTARSSYLTVNFDKEITGLTKDNFVVMLGDAPVQITSVSANNTNTAYSLNGSFKTGSEYALTVNVSDNYELAGLPLTITPKSSGESGGGGGGSITTSYKITVTQADGGKISPDTVSVNENGSKTFTITSNDGYEIEDVLVNGKSVGAVKEYTFDKVTASSEITAKFKKIVENPATSTEQPDPEKWENPFADVNEKDWFYEAVKYVNENGLMNGTDETTFAPDIEVTRAMFVTVLYRAEKQPNEGVSLFTDIESGSYYEKAVAWAAATGIVKGVSETKFAPGGMITREQMAAIIQRYAIFRGLDTTVSKTTSYADDANISDYAKEAVAFCTEHGIMSGKDSNSFDPLGHATRAEVASVLERVLKILQ